eukprot:scaffold217179_cov45-Attheya_sp.AAC.1
MLAVCLLLLPAAVQAQRPSKRCNEALKSLRSDLETCDATLETCDATLETLSKDCDDDLLKVVYKEKTYC